MGVRKNPVLLPQQRQLLQRQLGSPVCRAHFSTGWTQGSSSGRNNPSMVRLCQARTHAIPVTFCYTHLRSSNQSPCDVIIWFPKTLQSLQGHMCDPSRSTAHGNHRTNVGHLMNHLVLLYVHSTSHSVFNKERSQKENARNGH